MLKVSNSCNKRLIWFVLEKKKITCKDWTLLSSSAIYWSLRTRDLWAYCLQLLSKVKINKDTSKFKVYQHISTWTPDMTSSLCKLKSAYTDNKMKLNAHEDVHLYCIQVYSEFKDGKHWHTHSTCTVTTY